MEEVLEKLKKIEALSLLAAKSVLNLDEVVLLTGYSKQHLYTLACNKQIPYYKPNGKNLFFKKDEVEEWLTRGKVNTNEENEQAALAYCAARKTKKARV